jgi:hypothetical protein
MKDELRILTALATRVLEVPAQESCSERTFSGLTSLLTKARASIKPQLAGDMVINYMKRHRSRQSKLRPYPPLGQDWPEGLKGFVRLPPRDNDDNDDDAPQNELIENVERAAAEGENELIENVERAAAEGENELIENVERAAAEGDVIEDAEEQDVEEVVEDGIYPDDDDDDDQELRRPRRTAVRRDYAAMVRGFG